MVTPVTPLYSGGMNWVDLGIFGAITGGTLVGAQRGILRQLLLMAAFYVSLVAAARYYGEASAWVVAYVPQADRSVASAYALAGITAGGTLLLTWLSHQVYHSTWLPRIEVVDHVAGAGLGLAWSWAVVAFAVTVLAYGLTFSWGPNDALRRQLGAAVSKARWSACCGGRCRSCASWCCPGCRADSRRRCRFRAKQKGLAGEPTRPCSC
jgi:uncharacterized membrane protein required for colicin V production